MSADIPARRAARGERLPLSIKARQIPIKIEPVVGLADVVTDEQLIKALNASRPLWHPPTVPSLIHELKLWGRNANFTKQMVGQARSGTTMVETLLSDKLCRERTTPNGASFLVDSPFGINVVQSGTMDAKYNRAEGHYGQLLMVLGETGVPLNTPVTTASGRCGTIADILQEAVMRFEWSKELEFIGVALALWLPPETSWTDQFGNRYSFDELVEHLMAVPCGQGACGGCHIAYTIAVVLQVDSQYRILSSSNRQRAVQRLANISARLEKTKLVEGGWDQTWPGGGTKGIIYEDSLLDQITVIGHHLEWISLVQEPARPSRETVAHAVSACIADIDRLPPLDHRSFKTILPCSHAAHALCLLRNKDPFTTWMAYWAAKNSEVIKNTEKVSAEP
ncbi:MAG: hypothetical protein ABFC77_02570 [Thermoguttaceae bacterium]